METGKRTGIPAGSGSCEKAHVRMTDLSLAIRETPSQNCTGENCPVRHKALGLGSRKRGYSSDPIAGRYREELKEQQAAGSHDDENVGTVR